jgi:hypothetical protein
MPTTRKRKPPMRILKEYLGKKPQRPLTDQPRLVRFRKPPARPS